MYFNMVIQCFYAIYSIKIYYKITAIIPCVVQYTLVAYLLLYIVFCNSESSTLNLPPSPFSLVNNSLFSVSMSLF